MFEIGRRYVAEPRGVDTISFPGDVAKLLGAEMSLLDREEFRAIHLNTQGKVIGMETISIGSLNASLVHPRGFSRVLFCVALQISSPSTTIQWRPSA